MKRAPVLLCALLLLLLIVFISACNTGCELLPPGKEQAVPHPEFKLPDAPLPPPEAGSGRIGWLYYPERQWRFLVPLQREIPDADTIVRNTLEKLIGTPQLEKELELLGLLPVLSRETAILGIHIDEGLARVDFSSAFLKYDPECERCVLGSLLCTLHQFPEIERLEIMVEGEKPEKFPGGTPGRMPLGPECWINLEVGDALKDYRSFTAVKVYFCFPAANGRIFYVPVTRSLPPADDPVDAAIKELLAGPRRGSGLFSDIPPGTVLRSLHLEEGLMAIDLTKELLAYEGGRTGAENMVNQILLTLSEIEGVGKVQILVEGEKVKLQDGPDLTVPLQPPAVYNFF